MGFNYIWMLAWFAFIAVVDIGSGFIHLDQRVQPSLDALSVLLFVAVVITFSRVARHNLRQMFKSDAHQWVGDGSRCEQCSTPEASSAIN